MNETKMTLIPALTILVVLLSIIAGDILAAHTIKLWPNRSSYNFMIGDVR